MSLANKFALPLNLLIIVVLGASLVWEKVQLEAAGRSVLAARLDEEARLICVLQQAADASPAPSGSLDPVLRAITPSVTRGHMLTINGRKPVVWTTAPDLTPPLDPTSLQALSTGSWMLEGRDGPYLARSVGVGHGKVVVAESLASLKRQVWTDLRGLAGWYLGLGLLLLICVNALLRTIVVLPLQRLLEAVHLVGSGTLGAAVDTPGTDEIGLLGREFNQMSQNLARRIGEERRQLEFAHRAQTHWLPPAVQRIGCIEVAGRCLQAGPVGGDIFDVQAMPGGSIGVLVADVSGHDIAAALHTAMLRAAAWRELEHSHSPGEALHRLNILLSRYLTSEHFATAFLGVFEPTRSRFRYASAGHPSAWLRSDSAPLRMLDSTGLPLGILYDADYETLEVPLHAGDDLLACTDGLIETFNPQGQTLGVDPVSEALVSSAPFCPLEFVGRLMDLAAEFRAHTTQQDDISIMLARFQPHACGERASNALPAHAPLDRCARCRLNIAQRP